MGAARVKAAIAAAASLYWVILPDSVNADDSMTSATGHASRVVLDRVVVRFTSPETGGIDAPRFVLERELAFAARLEALADPTFRAGPGDPYGPAHLRAALERRIAETILESLEVSPQPTEKDIQARVNTAQAALAERVGGAAALNEAARAEGLGSLEIYRLLQRQARASLYLDRMVAPMLRPSDAELRALHRAGRTPFSKQSFEVARSPLLRWLVSKRLSDAVLAFYEGARSRLRIEFVAPQ